MIHYLCVGHFAKEGGAMRLQKRESDGAPRPVLLRQLDMAIVEELLKRKAIESTNIPEDWHLGIEPEGFIVCDAYTSSGEALDFLRQLATRTGCDVLYDGMVAFSADELACAHEDSQQRKAV
jgi:hypothetical protein